MNNLLMSNFPMMLCTEIIDIFLTELSKIRKLPNTYVA